MKKILSLTLAVLMVVSMVPTAFAADMDYQNGTDVEYTGSRTTVNADGTAIHNAEYTITVPALLAPGGSGTVNLEGYWPSDATVKVTAEEKVDMLNNITNGDKKELAVTFASIEKTGSNTAIVTASAPVSVANIANTLFGTWSGKFNYNVDYVSGSGNTGNSGTTEPSDPALVPGEGQFVFTIDGKEYLADDGMNWGAWCQSEYNTEGFKVTGSQYIANDDYIYIYTNNGSFVANSLPILSAIAYTSGPRVIRIIFDGTDYHAEEGMTWGKWVDSEYNTLGATIENNNVCINGKNIKRDGYSAIISADTEVLSDRTYVYA